MYFVLFGSGIKLILATSEMKNSCLSLLLLGASAVFAQGSSVVITPVSVTTSTTGDLWPVSNLIQGPGVGIQNDEPFDKISGGAAGNWVTGAPGGFPSDFIAVAGAPVLTFDMGADTVMTQVHTWGYSTSNANGARDFSLRFATEADGLGGFGTSIAANPSFSMSINDTQMQTNGFDRVNARYVEMTITSTHISGGGVGGPDGPAGGDRVGLGEVAFGIPEPSTSMLGLVALTGLVLRRRRG